MANHESELSITTDGGNGELVPVGQVSIPRSLKPVLKPFLQIIDGEIYIPLFIAEMLGSGKNGVGGRSTQSTSPDGCRHWSNPGRGGNPRGPGRYQRKEDYR